MATRQPTDYPIPESTTSGTDLARILERTELARASSDADTSRAAYLKRGAIWSQLNVAGDIDVMLYDGTNDIPLFNSLHGNGVVMAFNAAATYNPGDLVVRGGHLYSTLNAHTGAWSATDFQSIQGDIVSAPAAGVNQSITAAAPGDIPLTLTAAPAQTAHLLHVGTRFIVDKSGHLGIGGAPTEALEVVVGDVVFHDGNLRLGTGANGAALDAHASAVGLDVKEPGGNLIASFGPTSMKVAALTGTGSRMVVTNAQGVLSAQAIPSVSWSALTGKPTTFPPTIGTGATNAAAGNHTHAWAQITGAPVPVERSGNLTANHLVTGVNTKTVKDSGVTLNPAAKVMQFPAAWKLGIGSAPTAELTVAGAISATGEVTAFFSDARLKDEQGPMTGALDRVAGLRGFYYKPNYLAKELGAVEKNDNTLRVGLSAQDVELMLPEAVSPAPFNPEYMTVDYAKLVPLLVEAIKELKAEIEELKR